ncbi:MAG: serine/threonine-protein phosphatase [Micropruina sp.]|nr:serine/threonine-protein phosphatase [Micropruina sp.]
MLMVADGMGGAAAGDLASAVAIAELAATDADFTGQDMLAIAAGALERANARIADLVEAEPAVDGMGTTVCGVLFDGERLALVNIGDSRGYRLRAGALERLTRDHSWVQTLVDDGRITEEEALVHPHRSLILKVLNGQANHRPDLSLIDVEVGDRLLICSDGLCGLVTDAAIAAALIQDDPQQVLTDLIAMAHAEGGVDNITIILADVVEGPPSGDVVIMGAADDLDLNLIDTEPREDTIPIAVPKAADPEGVERVRYSPLAGRRPSTWVKVVLAVVLPVLAIAGGLAGWYSYIQTKFYVGPSNDVVAVFQGVPDQVIGLPLSRVIEADRTQLIDLPLFYQEQVRSTIVVPDLTAARNTLAELHTISQLCIRQREARSTMTATPTPTAPTSPSVTPGNGTESPSPNPNSSPSPTPPIESAPPEAPRDC